MVGACGGVAGAPALPNSLVVPFKKGNESVRTALAFAADACKALLNLEPTGHEFLFTRNKTFVSTFECKTDAILLPFYGPVVIQAGRVPERNQVKLQIVGDYEIMVRPTSTMLKAETSGCPAWAIRAIDVKHKSPATTSLIFFFYKPPDLLQFEA